MKKQTASVPCSTCKGSGVTPLSPKLAALYACFKKKTDSFTARDLHASSPNVTPSAINNHLEALRELGLLKREKKSRLYHYSLNLVPATPPTPET